MAGDWIRLGVTMTVSEVAITAIAAPSPACLLRQKQTLLRPYKSFKEIRSLLNNHLPGSLIIGLRLVWLRSTLAVSCV